MSANVTIDEEIFVQTPNGKLRGAFLCSCLGDDYYSFKGIPFAKPPIGPLRFREPEPAEPWSGVRDATKHGSVCLQYSLEKPSKLVGSEDCLYLNVYARKIDINLRLPVLVSIHGGTLTRLSGDEQLYGPDYFMTKKDIILVTFNYRLGIFGFLNLEDEVAPGNLGFKDQVFALQWIKNNISHFGGDPGNVTIFGVSAGARCVHYLTLSPLAEGLFHKAICQSGTSIDLHALKPDSQKCLDDFLNLLDYSESRDPKVVIEFLRSFDSHKLVETVNKLTTPQIKLTFNYLFGPCVDDKSSKPFMPVHPEIAAEKGVQVPFMIGHTDFEGLYMLRYIRAMDLEDIEINFEKYFFFWLQDILKKFNLSAEDIRNMYFGSEKISHNNLSKLLNFFSDFMYTVSAHKVVSMQVKNSSEPTYFYQFSYCNNGAGLFSVAPFKGTKHGDDLRYLFRMKIYEDRNIPQLPEGMGADETIMKVMIELWTNFAKTGNPTPATSDLIPIYWQPVDDELNLRYLNINEELRMEKEVNINQHFSSLKKINS